MLSDSRATQQPLYSAGIFTFWFTALALGLIWFVSEHDWNTSQLQQFAKSAADTGQSVASGSAERRVAVVCLAAIGAIYLLRRKGIRQQFCNLAGLLLGLYVTWCCASIVWSVDPALTARRVILLTLSLIGVIGVSRQLGVGDLVNISMVITAIFILIGLGAELAHGTFRPGTPDYRFAGTMHPNSQAVCCALLCLSSFCAAQGARQGKWMLLILMALGLTMLLLTKSRTACFALLVALGVFWLPNASRTKKCLLGIGMPLTVCSALLLVAFAGMDVEKLTARVVLLGRQAEAISLSGRIPLWTELSAYVAQRPLLGYGYGSFWTPAQIQTISTLFEWTIPNGHNDYLDTLLSVGLIGALLKAMLLLLVLTRAAVAYLRSGNAGLGFILALMMYGVMESLFESGFSQPTVLEPFIAACGLTHIVFSRGDAADRAMVNRKTTKTSTISGSEALACAAR